MATDEFAGNGAEMQAGGSSTASGAHQKPRRLDVSLGAGNSPHQVMVVDHDTGIVIAGMTKAEAINRLLGLHDLHTAHEEGRQSAFAAMVEEAAAITLGAATDRPSTYSEFMNAIRRAADGAPPKLRSLSYTEKLLIAGEMLVRDPSGVAMAAAEFKAKERANG